MENVIIGLDMSTKSSGYSVFKDGKLIKYGLWKQKPEILWRERCINMGNELSKLIENYLPNYIYCEDTILSGECGNNVQTVKQLSVLQGIVLGVCAVHNVKIEFLMPSKWRSDLGVYDGTRDGTKRPVMKKKTIDKVNDIFGMKLYYDLDKPKSIKNEDDIGDAIGIAWSQIKPTETSKGFGKKPNVKVKKGRVRTNGIEQ